MGLLGGKRCDEFVKDKDIDTERAWNGGDCFRCDCYCGGIGGFLRFLYPFLDDFSLSYEKTGCCEALKTSSTRRRGGVVPSACCYYYGAHARDKHCL